MVQNLNPEDVFQFNLMDAFYQAIAPENIQVKFVLGIADSKEQRAAIAKLLPDISEEIEKHTREELEELLKQRAIAAGVAGAILEYHKMIHPNYGKKPSK